ncbi:MAG: hypothetical protein HXS52_01335 [Theionarchaea archaeon]|nr:hypothetical protein [Theionarchaea archaeon]
MNEGSHKPLSPAGVTAVFRRLGNAAGLERQSPLCPDTDCIQQVEYFLFLRPKRENRIDNKGVIRTEILVKNALATIGKTYKYHAYVESQAC